MISPPRDGRTGNFYEAGCLITLPLSANRLFIATDSPSVAAQVREASDQEVVEAANRQSLMSAKQFAYGAADRDMRATVLHGPRDIRCEEVAGPKILHPTDAIIQLSATCIGGSGVWPYRGIQEVQGPMHMGHEYCGIVVEVGSEVRTVLLHLRQHLPA